MIRQKEVLRCTFLEHSWFLCNVEMSSYCSGNEQLHSKGIRLCHLGSGWHRYQCVAGIWSLFRVNRSISHPERLMKSAKVSQTRALSRPSYGSKHPFSHLPKEHQERHQHPLPISFSLPVGRLKKTNTLFLLIYLPYRVGWIFG